MNPEQNPAAGAAENDTTFEPLPEALRFEAGKGDEHHATHGSIAQALAQAGFTPYQVRATYYGNWLRDYSQLLDPKIVRSVDTPKTFPDLLSREALTQIVDVLAVREFNDLMEQDRRHFNVTPERLGVYRPSEHLDNPSPGTGEYVDFKKIDADFEDWVSPDDASLQVDAETSMKKYIQRSVDFMKSRIDEARQRGPDSTDGLRDFGAALHVLEDFFAHSNFVELSLIKMGYTEVLPWTSKADCKHGLPITTGTFSGSDIIASLAAPLGEILFSIDDKPFVASQPGVRYERDIIIQILLREHPDSTWYDAHETFLSTRDTWANLPFSEQAELIYSQFSLPGKIVGNAIGVALQGLTTLVGNSVDDLQTTLGDDPHTNGSTDPSHSQLAKDHAEHPLHMLAAQLAEHAVLRTGQAMLEQWHKGSEAPDPAAVAASYFTHPMDSSWQDALVKSWAESNPGQVERAEKKHELEKFQREVMNSAQNGLNRFNTESANFLGTFSGISSVNDVWSIITGQ